MQVGYKTSLDIFETGTYVVEFKNENMNDKFVIFYLEGGLGKNVASTSIIKDLKEKHNDRKLIMVVSYPEIFLNNPYVDRVYRVGMTSYFYDDYIKEKNTIVYRHEPYFQSGHIMLQKHLIESWCDLLGLKYTKQLPKLYPNFIQKNMVINWVRERPTMVIQTGGGAAASEQQYSWSRDIPFPIANLIVERYKKDYHIIQITRQNGYKLEGVEIVTQQLSNFDMFSIIAASEKRVLIDSSLQHAAAGVALKSTVLWIGTSPINFGYEGIHTNVVAKKPSGATKMIDSMFFNYNLEGTTHECPYSDITDIFNITEVCNAIDKT
jgi:hypothetical protein